MLCRPAHPPKVVVKLEEYRYSNDLKELAKRSLEDSEHLSFAAKQKLPYVRWEKKGFFVCLFVWVFLGNSALTLPSVQGPPGICPSDADICPSLSPSATPGGDTDGGRHQEVRPVESTHDSGST